MTITAPTISLAVGLTATLTIEAQKLFYDANFLTHSSSFGRIKQAAAFSRSAAPMVFSLKKLRLRTKSQESKLRGRRPVTAVSTVCMS